MRNKGCRGAESTEFDTLVLFHKSPVLVLTLFLPRVLAVLLNYLSSIHPLPPNNLQEPQPNPNPKLSCF